MGKNLSGIGVQQFPSPDEKDSLNPGGSIKGTGMGAGLKKISPFKSSYDATPSPTEKQGDLKGSRVDNVC